MPSFLARSSRLLFEGRAPAEPAPQHALIHRFKLHGDSGEGEIGVSESDASDEGQEPLACSFRA
jgi:hypothetical protein